MCGSTRAPSWRCAAHRPNNLGARAMRCRRLHRERRGLAAAAASLGILLWLASHPPQPSQPPQPQPQRGAAEEEGAPPVLPEKKLRRFAPKRLFVERGVTCASGIPTEGRVFHLAAAGISADACVERCRAEDACAIFTWVGTGAADGSGSCWYRIGGRKGTWIARRSAANAVSGCSIDAVVGCDPAQPFLLKDVLHANDVKRADAADADARRTSHPGCPQAFRKRWTAGSIALMLELLDQLHGELEELGVPYSLFGATLLGQMRHGGFIPWEVGQAQIAIRHMDVGAVRHQLEPSIASSSSSTSLSTSNEKGAPKRVKAKTPRRPWLLAETKIGFRLKFAEVDGMLSDLHRSFLIDVFVLGRGGGVASHGIDAPEDLLRPVTIDLSPFHSRMYRVSANKIALLELSGLAGKHSLSVCRSSTLYTYQRNGPAAVTDPSSFRLRGGASSSSTTTSRAAGGKGQGEAGEAGQEVEVPDEEEKEESSVPCVELAMKCGFVFTAEATAEVNAGLRAKEIMAG